MKPDAINESYEFVKWVTPDMEPMAVKLAKEVAAPNAFENHLPDPLREPGEREVLVDGWGRERVMLIQVEIRASSGRITASASSRNGRIATRTTRPCVPAGAMQIGGGLEKLPVSSIKDVKPPASLSRAHLFHCRAGGLSCRGLTGVAFMDQGEKLRVRHGAPTGGACSPMPWWRRLITMSSRCPAKAILTCSTGFTRFATSSSWSPAGSKRERSTWPRPMAS